MYRLLRKYKQSEANVIIALSVVVGSATAFGALGFISLIKYFNHLFFDLTDQMLTEAVGTGRGHSEPLEVELPAAVDLKVTEAESDVKGDTATGATKSVTTETGIKVKVPLFVETGNVIRVDTRSGEYLTRV